MRHFSGALKHIGIYGSTSIHVPGPPFPFFPLPKMKKGCPGTWIELEPYVPYVLQASHKWKRPSTRTITGLTGTLILILVVEGGRGEPELRQVGRKIVWGKIHTSSTRLHCSYVPNRNAIRYAHALTSNVIRPIRGRAGSNIKKNDVCVT